jgi:hypothetical protein
LEEQQSTGSDKQLKPLFWLDEKHSQHRQRDNLSALLGKKRQGRFSLFGREKRKDFASRFK